MIGAIHGLMGGLGGLGGMGGGMPMGMLGQLLGKQFGMGGGTPPAPGLAGPPAQPPTGGPILQEPLSAVPGAPKAGMGDKMTGVLALLHQNPELLQSLTGGGQQGQPMMQPPGLLMPQPQQGPGYSPPPLTGMGGLFGGGGLVR